MASVPSGVFTAPNLSIETLTLAHFLHHESSTQWHYLLQKRLLDLVNPYKYEYQHHLLKQSTCANSNARSICSCSYVTANLSIAASDSLSICFFPHDNSRLFPSRHNRNWFTGRLVRQVLSWLPDCRANSVVSFLPASILADVSTMRIV